MIREYGIDLSNYQHPTGQFLDWTAIKASGLARWIALLGGDGLTMLNKYLAQDASGSRSIGSETSIYFYGRPSQGNPAGQALILANLIRTTGPYSKVIVDIENGAELGWAAVDAFWRSFLRVQSADLFYCPRSYLPVLSALAIPASRTWLAAPGIPPTNSPYAAIQYGQGPIPGIPGQVDLDAVYYGDDMLDLNDLGAIEALLEGHFSKATPTGTYEQGSLHYMIRNRNFLDGTVNDPAIARIDSGVSANHALLLDIQATLTGLNIPNVSPSAIAAIATAVANELARRLVE